jgi:hypothetical protein
MDCHWIDEKSYPPIYRAEVDKLTFNSLREQEIKICARFGLGRDADNDPHTKYAVDDGGSGRAKENQTGQARGKSGQARFLFR